MSACCRLCLQRQATTDSVIPLLNSTGPDDDQHTDLITKIRTCLGVVFLDPSPEHVICINCHQTVLLVDDFRSLCLQTNQVFGLISIGEGDLDKQASYQMYVEELRHMLQEQKNGIQELIDAGGVGQVKVKLEPGAEVIEGADQQKESFVICTVEMVKGEPMVEDSVLVEVPKIQEPCRESLVFEEDVTFPLNLKIDLIKQIKGHSELWNAIFEGSALQTQLWSKVARLMSLDVPTVQAYWQRLQMMFQDYLLSGGHMNSEQMTPEQAKLMKDLETMVEGNRKSVEMRARLADEIFKRSIIWDDRHPDYDKDRRRRDTWDEIAKVLGTDRVAIRTPWQMFVNDARKNPVTDERMLVNPLYRLLHETLAERLRPKARWPPRRCEQQPVTVNPECKSAIPVLPQRAQRPLGNFEIREKLAEEILQHEVLWNDKHPDFRSSAMRTEIFKGIGSRLQVDWKEVRREWGLCVSMARKSSEENGGKVDEKLYAKDPLQKLLNITVVERLGAIPRRRYKPSTEKRKKREQKKALTDNFCEICNKYIPRKRFEGHMNAHNGVQPYECSHEGCGKRFTNKENLRNHRGTVHAELRFECTECDRKFVAPHKLEVHVALVHKSHDLPCTICGKLLKHRSSLLIHMRRHEQKYPCSFCDAQLSTKHALNEHERIHTNEKPYPCPECDKSFRTNTAKRMHVYKMHFVPAAGSSSNS